MGWKRLAKWYGPANKRRAELIDKKIREGLTPEELVEFTDLQSRCMLEVDRVFRPQPLLIRASEFRYEMSQHKGKV